MITYPELLALLVFVGMGIYISYLQHQLKKAHAAGQFMAMVLHDISTGEVEIERTDNGISIRKGDREVQVHQRRTP